MRLFLRPKKQISDESLIEAYRSSGDMGSLADLFSRYTHLVFFICAKYLPAADCEDTAMEIFELLSRAMSIHQVTNFKSWLGTTTRNHCLMKLRKNKGITFESIENMMENEENEKDFMQNYDFEHLLESEALVQSLNRSIERLDERQKLCLKLFYFENKSYEEITTTLQISQDQVRSHLQNAKRNLRILLGKAHYAELSNA